MHASDAPDTAPKEHSQAPKSLAPRVKSAVASLQPHGDIGFPALTLGPTPSVAALGVHLTFRSECLQLSAPSEGASLPGRPPFHPPVLIQICLLSSPHVSHSSLGLPA